MASPAYDAVMACAPLLRPDVLKLYVPAVFVCVPRWFEPLLRLRAAEKPVAGGASPAGSTGCTWTENVTL